MSALRRGACATPVAILLAALGGCAVGPDYVRPELDMPEAYPITVDGQTGADLADIAWFDLFDDPRLDSLIGTALDDNLELRSALARVLEARQGARFANASRWPNIGGALASSPAPGVGNNDTNYSLGIAFAWELDFFGKLRRNAAAAEADALASEEGARAVTVSLVSAVAASYVQILELDRRIDIVERTIESQTESLELVEELKVNGVSSAAEQNQAAALLASTKASLPELRRARIATENGLSVLLGRPPQSFVPAGTVPQTPELPDFTVDLPVELLADRPDIRAAEEQLRAATNRVGVAIANRFPFPTLGLTALAARFSPSLDGLFDDGTDAFSWGPTGSIPLIDFGRTDSAVQIADAQLLQAAQAYQLAVLSALREVTDALAGLEAASEVITHNRERTDAAAEVLRLQRLRFRQGVVAYLEVLDAERQLLAASLELATAEFGRVQRFIELYRALGGGADEERLERTMEALQASGS
ncbi:MAG: efflux transporter outer membrane subunit [Pseudomonadota bacterium]